MPDPRMVTTYGRDHIVTYSLERCSLAGNDPASSLDLLGRVVFHTRLPGATCGLAVVSVSTWLPIAAITLIALL